MSYCLEFYMEKFVKPIDAIIKAYDKDMEDNTRSPWSMPSLPLTILNKRGAPTLANDVRERQPFAGKWPTRIIFFNRLSTGPKVFYFGKPTYRPWRADKTRHFGRDVFRIEFDTETLVNVWSFSRGGTAVSNLIYNYYPGSSGWANSYFQPYIVTREPFVALYQRAR